jgi:hypothetical protein
METAVKLIQAGLVILAVLMTIREAHRFVETLAFLRSGNLNDIKWRARLKGYLAVEVFLFILWGYVFWTNASRLF